MNNQNFINYLFTKMEQTDNVSISTFDGKGNVSHIIPNAPFNLEILTKDDKLAWTISGYPFDEKCRKAMIALVRLYNDNANAKYQLCIDYNKLKAYDIIDVADEHQAISVIDSVINWFTKGGDFISEIQNVTSSATARARKISARVDDLKTRACEYENQGKHDKAMKCYHEICQYYGYGHMELIALLYANGTETKAGKFPISKDYQLECFMLAATKDKDNVFAPLLAYGVANSLGKTDLLKQIIAIGQERGTWNMLAFREGVDSAKMLERVADCYRKGIGCEPNETYAVYYDRLIKGERQEVFKDMLTQGFEPVFDLMTSNEYYKVTKLSDLDCLYDGFKQRFLLGTDDFDLPVWFPGVVNSLSTSERDSVLTEVKDKFNRDIQTFMGKFKSKDIEIIDEWDEDGILVEDNAQLRYVSLYDFAEVIPCKMVDEISSALTDFKTETAKGIIK